MEEINKSIRDKGASIRRTISGNIVKRFDESDASFPLIVFLYEHPSCRVVFNAMVKSGFPNLEDAMIKIPKLVRESNTSFLFTANCTGCQNPLDHVNICENRYNLPEKKEIGCTKCKKNNILGKSNYRPNFSINKKDVMKLLGNEAETGIFFEAISVECLKCEQKTPLEPPSPDFNVNLKCPSCGHLRIISNEYLPRYQEIITLTNNQQGYWLDWYVWKLLVTTIPTCVSGVEINLGHSSFEADILGVYLKKLFIVQCSDGGDHQKVIAKLKLMEKIADGIFLVSTQDSNWGDVIDASDESKKIFIVPPSDIEKIGDIIQKKLYPNGILLSI